MNELVNLWWVVIIVLVLVSGLSLCFPISLIKLTRAGARRFDLPTDEVLNRSISVDGKIYRHHFLSGASISVLSAVTLYLLIFKVDVSPYFSHSAGNPYGWQSLLFECLITIALVGAVVGLCAGLIIMLRPSLLKSLEAWGNRWIPSIEQVLDRDVSGDAVENWVIQHIRLFGVLVLLAALIIWLLVFGLN